MRPYRLALGIFLAVACTPDHPAQSAYEHASREHPVEDARLSTTYASSPSLGSEQGQASYYGNSLAGHQTASGEPYDPEKFTAAHRTLALGTVVRVTRADTGASVVVRITDRGPFGSSRRVIDLSHAAAEKLRMIRDGVADVRLDVLQYGAPRRKKKR